MHRVVPGAPCPVRGPSKLRDSERLAGNVLLLARLRRGWTQQQLADAAGVPVSTVSRIETGARQPSWVTLSRLLAAADLKLRHHLEDYDDHDDVLDARRAALTEEERAAADAASSHTSALLAASRERASRRQAGSAPASQQQQAPAR